MRQTLNCCDAKGENMEMTVGIGKEDLAKNVRFWSPRYHRYLYFNRFDSTRNEYVFEDIADVICRISEDELATLEAAAFASSSDTRKVREKAQ